MAKALALFSGGLDSLLSILVILKQDIEVTAVKFLTPFNSKTIEQKRTEKINIGNFCFEILKYPIEEKFLEVLKKPKFGYGKNLNPCIDCKILMLKEAKNLMLEKNYDFIITGEVLWQRPMSQRKDTIFIIDREASVKGHIIRPLSAKLLPPSIPEEKGIVDREKLYDFLGRTRKPQMRLAKELGLNKYSQPAGGCLLTDPLYTARLKDLIHNKPDFTLKDIELLRLGRHFRVSKTTKIVVGRNIQENKLLQSFIEPSDYTLWVEGVGSPLTLIKGDTSEAIIRIAASICAKHSDAKENPEIEVTYSVSGKISTIKINPINNETMESYRI
ncbi:MAG: hypothetical protein N3A59_05785 [Thermodesulfovibrionales bacterium]|nr:hypothetical protein [Thermodesulfovibrionales bacterium]